MQKQIIYIFIIFTLVIPISCEDHFDIDPKTEILEEDLFSEESGYYNVLYGVYLKLNQQNLYGKTLTYDILEDLAQSYSGTRYRIRGYDYFEPLLGQSGMTAHDRFTSIWETMYNAIAECNNLLENLEASPIEFPDGNREMVKAEAMAIRAFLHFDLLRMFAPSVISDPESPAIPYVDNFSLQDFPRLTVNQVLDKIIADLKSAESLLQVHDPIFIDDPDAKPTLLDLHNSSLIRFNREARMNYYSVLGILSRVQLYAGNKNEAFTYAKKVIEADRFRLPTNAIDYRDPILTGVFAISISYNGLNGVYAKDFITETRRDITYYQLESVYEADLIRSKDILPWNYRNYGLSEEEYQLYASFFSENGTNDARISRKTGKMLIWEDLLEINDTLDFVSDNPGDRDYRLFENFYKSTENSGVRFLKFPDLLHENVPSYLPLLKLSELYLIAAEAAPDLNEGLNYLNMQRASANVMPSLSADDITSAELLQDEIEKEYKKELLAEGQLFYYFKRLNLDTFKGTNGVTIREVDDEIYVIPIPTDQGF
ncbi:RagB/SusD family nutrient uptake outer membrane protein [Marinifilum sp.]|uniref:RagB/SusD family nutrient uptake outer membrane protein n=1 Tax=Marinifilum sp. TaxID=2033137 RepID=UPI003BACF237